MRFYGCSLLALASLAVSCAVGDDVASNEDFVDGSADDGSTSDGSGGRTDSAAGGGAGAQGGGAGSGAQGGGAGSGAAGAGGGCSPGEQDLVGNCDRCGSLIRTCDASGAWGPDECTNQGTCDPGETNDCLCSTYNGTTACCGEETCSDTCTWGGCDIKSGKECDWEAGENFRCCSTGHWEYCLNTCLWSGNCAPCTGCGC